MRTSSQQEPLVGGSSRPVVLGRDRSPGSLSNRSIDHFASSILGMHHSNDRIAREYAQTPRPPPFRLGMTRLAQHDDEVFNSWRDQDEFAAAEFFPVPPILPDPVRRPDFAKVARLANQLKRGISDTLPFPDLVMVALDLLFTLRSMVMSQVQWQDYREALRCRDEEASQGRRGPTSTQPSQSHPTCAPVNPIIDETAVEYAGVWVLKLAYREGRQRAHILGNFYNTLQDIVAFANWRLRGPRIHYSVVADLVRRGLRRSRRWMGSIPRLRAACGFPVAG
ncbi:hypothetical protein AC1031_004194 [Aphanomyces cochlioides]|nr:hypothetical protein AC1031_004194 [Aphanomyces cochlioides]